MKTAAAIVQPAEIDLALVMEHITVENAGLRDDVRTAERHESETKRHSAAAQAARESARQRRLRIGKHLASVRPLWPARGPAPKGVVLPPGAPANWAEFLKRLDIDDATARRYMDEAADPEGFAQRNRVSETPDLSELDLLAMLGRMAARMAPDILAKARGLLKPPRDAAEPGDRDSWCTPPEITAALPLVDLDPCSNERSTVRAALQCWLSRGEDGLKVPWRGSLWINGPFSDLEPWAVKLDAEWPQITACGWLCNTDSTTEWWRIVIQYLPLRLDLNDRTPFVPPPGVKASSNDRAQTLLMTDTFWRGCDQPALLKLGTLWRRSGPVTIT
jgi:hypothetical protein